MIFVLSGMSLLNKGAELMLYAILKEISTKYPEATVYLPIQMRTTDIAYAPKNVTLKLLPWARLIQFVRRFRLNGILRKLRLPEILDDIYAIKNADYFIDASGLVFSDQNKSLVRQTYKWEHLLKNLHKAGTKIIFMPQAFGPIAKEYTKKAVASIGKYADLVFAREKVSYEYLQKSNLISMDKVRVNTDFTASVDGFFPDKYARLKNGICVIPNKRMIDKGVISKSAYIDFISHVVQEGISCGHLVYLLNHEGLEDENLALEAQQKLGKEKVEVVSRLNAIETKGLIASAYAVISSRFHGVASALHTGVPCLATSWNHKYAELLADYDLYDCVLDVTQLEASMDKVKRMLKHDNNEKIRAHLIAERGEITSENCKMWNDVWKYSN